MTLQKAVKRTAALLFIAGAMLTTSWWVSIYGYQRLTSETLIAELRFVRQQDGHHVAILSLPGECDDLRYVINGDQWRLDVQFEKVRYWANLLGFDSLYRLDRLQGRYQSVDAENSSPQLAHDLRNRDSQFDSMQRLSQKLFGFMYDTSYGSSNYAEIDPSKRYLIYKTPTGLVTRRMVISDARVNQHGLTITIDRACGKSEKGWLKRIFSSQTADADAQ